MVTVIQVEVRGSVCGTTMTLRLGAIQLRKHKIVVAMANWFEPTETAKKAWETFVASRPTVVREAIEKSGLVPWKLYRMSSTGHRVYLYSFDEQEDGTVTVQVDVTGQFNLVMMERRVFGIALDELTECDLPAVGEPLGSAGMSPEEALAAMRKAKPS